MSVGDIDIRKVARTLSLIENRRPGAEAVLREAYALARRVPVIGLTGPPGAGKSTLVDWLAVYWAEQGERVAVLAVDPSSPYTGGAVLGDRFRMNRASAHPRVFVRSFASRGQVGGLSRAVQDAVTVIASLGFDRVLVETVGSGQADIEVANLADCVLVVSVPGLGDHIQAAKAGILEIGDIYLVNKCDQPGADSVVGHLEANLDLIYSGRPGLNPAASGHGGSAANASVRERHGRAGEGEAYWRPPVLRLTAAKGSGVPELAEAVDAFLGWQRETGREQGRRAERFGQHVLKLAQGRLLAQQLPADSPHALPRLAEAVASGAMGPSEAADGLLRALFEAWRDARAAEDGVAPGEQGR